VVSRLKPKDVAHALERCAGLASRPWATIAWAAISPPAICLIWGTAASASSPVWIRICFTGAVGGLSRGTGRDRRHVGVGAGSRVRLGGAAGGLEKVLTDHGVNHEDAAYYDNHVSNGGVFVSIDPSEADITSEAAADILQRSGGHSSAQARTASNI